MRQQFKEGADFIKIYETGPDAWVKDGKFSTVYQYTEAELAGAVQEAARVGSRGGGACDRGTGNVVCGAGGSGID